MMYASFFQAKFFRDFKELPAEIKKEVRIVCIDVFPALRDLRSFDLYPVKPISGFRGYYRIKIGEYRIGFKRNKDTIEFMRVRNRKDIYRYFP